MRAGSATGADEGALPLVQWLSKHPDPFVRRALAEHLLWLGKGFKDSAAITAVLADDPDPLVREAALGAMLQPAESTGQLIPIEWGSTPSLHS